jgi:iron complex transport system substrate-binding protein
MKRPAKYISGLMAAVLLSLTAAACGSSTNNTGLGTATGSPTASVSPAAAAKDNSTQTQDKRKYKDWSGHEVEIKAQPERVIYHGEVTGDLLALGVKPIGIGSTFVKGTVFENELKDAQDVGFPLNVEKALQLDADVIIFSNNDEAQYQQISKAGPTVTFNSFAPLEDRMRTLGDLFNKKQQAEDWITAYNTKTAEMWKKLHASGMKESETASVFTMYPGNRLFVMATTGLSQVLYHEQGFKAPPNIQELLNEKTGFKEISAELLPEYAGDRIFLLEPVAEEAKQSSSELMKTQVWLGLPAVVNKQVYSFEILKAGSDATSREWLLEELPRKLAP